MKMQAWNGRWGFGLILGWVLLLAWVVPAGGAWAGEPLNKPVIILKLDDLTNVTPAWQRCTDFLQAQNIKASFGIIGFALETPSPQLVAFIKKLHQSGMVEFWNHGYKNRKSKDEPDEFGSADVQQQLQALNRTQTLAREKLGFSLACFGPHWSPTNATTEQALVQCPEITAVFFYTKPLPARPWFVFERKLELENPLFRPNPDSVKTNFEKLAATQKYFCMQGHPNQWDEKRFEDFTKAVLYLKEQGCPFMTASEYIKSVTAAAK